MSHPEILANEQVATPAEATEPLASKPALVGGPVGDMGSAPARPSLKSRAIGSSAWTTIDYVAAQLFRFVGSLILTRLLAPDVFGVMTMINVFFQGLEMFSDIGIGPAVIHNKRGDKQEFLDTAFTMQALRGLLLFVASCIAAWPLAVFYDQPALVYLIPITGLSSIVMGLNSTSLVYLNRQLRLREVTLLNIGEQVVRYVAVIGWALFSPTVWALIFGTMIAQIFQTAVSHFILPGHRNRFRYNRQDAHAMFRFGRWVFMSTAMTFLAMQGDKIMIGKLLGVVTLGIYNNAAMLAFAPIQFLKLIGGRVAFPALAEIVRQRPAELYQQSRRVRRLLMGVSFAVGAGLVVLGDWFVWIAYPDEFHDAGWMLQILAAGTMAGIVNSTYGAVLWALGRTFDAMLLLAIQLVLLFGACAIGYRMNGETGFIVGVATVEWLNYPATAWVMRRQKLWQPELDLPVLAAAAVIIAATFQFMPPAP